METSNTRITGHGITVTADVRGAELKYIAAYREVSSEFYSDLAGGNGSPDYRLDTNAYDGPAADMAFGGPTPRVIPSVEQDQWSQELHLSGTLLDESVDYIVGAVLFHEEAREPLPYSHQVSSGIAPGGAAQFGPVIDVVSSDGAPRLVVFNERDYGAENDASGLFAQIGWTPEAMQRLHLTLGYRHTEDKRFAVKTFVQENYLEGDLGATLVSSAESFDNVRATRSYSNDSFSYIAKYEASDEVNLYAKYVQGYRSGGFNLRDPQLSGQSGPASDGVDYGFGFTDGFRPEEVGASEVGIKSELFQRRLRVNADIFQADFRDLQIPFLIGGTLGDTKTTNAGKARLRGFELDLSFAASESLLLSGQYVYLDAKVQEVIDSEGRNVADQFPFQSAPRHSGTVSADITLARLGYGDDRSFITYSYTAEKNGGGLPGRRDLTMLRAFDLLNARVGIFGVPVRGGSLDIGAYVHNALDEEFQVLAIANLPQPDRAILYGDPRAFGVDFNFRW